MTVNTPHQGDCLFLQIWPKIKECSLPPGSARVSKPNDLWRCILDLFYQSAGFSLWISFLYYYVFGGNITCVWYSGSRCPPGGGAARWAGLRHRFSSGRNINNAGTWGESSIWARPLCCWGDRTLTPPVYNPSHGATAACRARLTNTRNFSPPK